MNSKYRNQKTAFDGNIYDSRKEASRAAELNLLLLAGKIQGLEHQVPFELVPARNGERSAKYIADFVYIEDDRKVVEDVKSDATRRIPVYVLKRKLFKHLYPQYDFREV